MSWRGRRKWQVSLVVEKWGHMRYGRNRPSLGQGKEGTRSTISSQVSSDSVVSSIWHMEPFLPLGHILHLPSDCAQGSQNISLQNMPLWGKYFEAWGHWKEAVPGRAVWAALSYLRQATKVLWEMCWAASVFPLVCLKPDREFQRQKVSLPSFLDSFPPEDKIQILF